MAIAFIQLVVFDGSEVRRGSSSLGEFSIEITLALPFLHKSLISETHWNVLAKQQLQGTVIISL